ncbi:non-canonical purine NTP pyrophosphatase, partial [Kibdelosporangium lantanae]
RADVRPADISASMAGIMLTAADVDQATRMLQLLVDGVLTTAPRGSGGFGYDCVFQPDGSKLTLAEMSDEVKNGISHRRLAVDSMRKALGIASH